MTKIASTIDNLDGETFGWIFFFCLIVGAVIMMVFGSPKWLEKKLGNLA